jgi:hypothetical protein
VEPVKVSLGSCSCRFEVCAILSPRLQQPMRQPMRQPTNTAASTSALQYQSPTVLKLWYTVAIVAVNSAH